MAVLPASTPDNTPDFFTYGAMLTTLSSALFIFRFFGFFGLEQEIQFLVIGMVVEKFVQLSTGLHARDRALLRAFGAYCSIYSQRSGTHGAKCGKRIKHQGNICLGQFLDC